MTDPEPTPTRRRVRRGEGEVTEWPRGLVAYVPKGSDEGTASIEEDRTRNRILLAGRLLALLRAQGREVDAEVAELRAAEQALSHNDRRTATELVERLLAALDRLTGERGGPPA